MKKEKQSRKGKKIYRVLIGLIELVLVLLMVAGLAGVYIYKSGEMALRASAETKAPEVVSDVIGEQRLRAAYEQNTQKTLMWQEDWIVYEDTVYEYKDNCLNFLLMGIDRSGELSKDTDLSDWSAGQADAIFLVSLDTDEKKISVIGIPRNAMVNLEIYNQEEECIDTIYNQICLQYGYAGGGELGLEKMKDSVSDLLMGLPIHGACAVSYDAIGVITDMLGGIEVTIPEDMTAYRGDYTAGSIVTLNGKNVVEYLRYRDNSELGSPTTRLTRQKEFMKAAIDDAVQAVKKNPAVVKEMYQAVLRYMNTDITLDKAVYLAAQSLDYSIADNSFYQLTGEDKRVDFEQPQKSEDFYDDFYLDKEYLTETLVRVFYREVVVDMPE